LILAEPHTATGQSVIHRIQRIAPGVAMLIHYRKQDLPHDLIAGLSVAAVAVPVGVAYAELAGFNPVVGLYSSILPLVAYALFGSSRQLIVGPDAATCALVAAAVMPLAAGDPTRYMALSMTLALLAGLLSIGASFFKFGVLADFLSRPILAGFMNGIALSIALGQLGKIFGFTIEAGGILRRLFEFAEKIGLTHLPTLAIGLGSFAVLLIAPKLLPRLPAALAAMVVAALAVRFLGLEQHGVHVVGELQAGLPALGILGIELDQLKTLVADAAGIALISFTSGMLTARSFAARNGYDVDADRDMAALGAANIASAISNGFAVSGADSRTAMNDAAGGRTQVAGLVAAVSIAVVLIFLTAPLRYVPQAALGAVLIMAAWSLVDIQTVRTLWREDKGEFAISVIVTLGVVVVGSIDAILFAVVLALLRFVRIVARPPCEVLGEVPGLPGFHSSERHPDANTIPGICLFRFNSPVVFFNAPYFKREALQAAAAAGPSLRWFVLDAVPITSNDVTGRHALLEVVLELEARGVQVALAGRQTEFDDWRREKGLEEARPRGLRKFPTLWYAVRVLQEELHSETDPFGGQPDDRREAG
jgi:high affinity sulfate transporter 1